MSERSIRQDVAGLLKDLRHYRGVCFDIRREADGIVVVCGNETLRLFQEGKGKYVLEYDADIASARATFEKGTVLGRPGDLEMLADLDAGGPTFSSTYSGPYLSVRIAFDRMIAIFLEKSLN